MIRLTHPARITREELISWARDPAPALPENADVNVWDLMLLDWNADVGLYLDVAADDTYPKREYFIGLLRQGLRRRCERTRWLAKSVDGVLLGIPEGHAALAKRKGGGKKEKRLARQRLTDAVHDEAALCALESAHELLRLARPLQHRHSDVAVLVVRLEAFIADSSTIGDEYWDRIPTFRRW